MGVSGSLPVTMGSCVVPAKALERRPRPEARPMARQRLPETGLGLRPLGAGLEGDRDAWAKFPWRGGLASLRFSD